MKKISLFFVTPIGDDASLERKRADSLLNHVLLPLFSEKFEITKADLIDAPGNINHDIIERLYSAELVIADLTGFNPNVMYEVGVRHSFNKPIIQIAQTGVRLPFDVATERTHFFDLGDLDSVSKAKIKLARAVDEILQKEKEYRSPVFGVLNNAAVFEQGGDIAEALETLSERLDSFVDDMWMRNSTGSSYSGSTEDMIEKIYSVITAIPSWEAEKLVDKLRKL